MSIFNAAISRNQTGEERKEEKSIYRDDISPKELQEMFTKGIVHFRYRKKAKKGQPFDSGDIRDAWGTKFGEFITKMSHGGYCPPKQAGYSIYFDVEKEDWRAFSDALLLGVFTKIYTEEEYLKELAKIEAEKAKEKDLNSETV